MMNERQFLAFQAVWSDAVMMHQDTADHDVVDTMDAWMYSSIEPKVQCETCIHLGLADYELQNAEYTPLEEM
jgi:hypothetical protein